MSVSGYPSNSKFNGLDAYKVISVENDPQSSVQNGELYYLILKVDSQNKKLIQEFHCEFTPNSDIFALKTCEAIASTFKFLD